MPLLPFLPEKDLSVEPYYTTKEIVTSLLENKMFGINLFEKFYFIYNTMLKSNNLSEEFHNYYRSIGLYYVYEYLSSYVKGYELYKENNNKINNNLIESYFYQFLRDTWFSFLINGGFTSRVLKNEYNPNGEPVGYNFSYIGARRDDSDNIASIMTELFENSFELFKKNKLFLNQDLYILNSYYNLVGDYSQKYFFELTFKYSNNLKSSFKIDIETARNLNNIYVPLPPTENITTKLELKNYRKKVLKGNGFRGPIKSNNYGANKNGGQDYSDGNQLPLSYYTFNNFVYGKITPKIPEEGNSNINFSISFISKDIYGLIEKKDLINTDTSLFTERFINKAKRYLMRNRNDKLFESVPNEMIEQVIEQNGDT
jgi:hypothetical protein